MRRRNTEIEIIELILAIGEVVCTVLLFFRHNEMLILYPIIFGIAALLSLLYALEGVLYNRSRVIKKSRLILFGLLTLLMIFLAIFSSRVVL